MMSEDIKEIQEESISFEQAAALLTVVPRAYEYYFFNKPEEMKFSIIFYHREKDVAKKWEVRYSQLFGIESSASKLINEAIGKISEDVERLGNTLIAILLDKKEKRKCIECGMDSPWVCGTCDSHACDGVKDCMKKHSEKHVK